MVFRSLGSAGPPFEVRNRGSYGNESIQKGGPAPIRQTEKGWASPPAERRNGKLMDSKEPENDEKEKENEEKKYEKQKEIEFKRKQRDGVAPCKRTMYEAPRTSSKPLLPYETQDCSHENPQVPKIPERNGGVQNKGERPPKPQVHATSNFGNASIEI